MPAGRPRITLEDLQISWQTIVLDLMKEGGSLTEVKGELGISNDLFERLREDEKEFSDTINKGLQLSAQWWEAKGRKNLENPKFNYVGWYMNMKNRFGWKDKTDITSNDQPIVSVKDLVLSLHETGRSKKNK